MNNPETKLTRIGVFYDGNYFLHVSNYYTHHHKRKARINVHGLHDFIKHEVAKLESVDFRYCQVVDAHYFRGRLSADDAQNRDKLYSERLFEDVLMQEGIITHYLPLTNQGEKGIDVWFSLEAFELAILKKFNILVLIACDSDYIPLIRKLNTLGTRVMVLGWDFSYRDEYKRKHETVTSVKLLQEATYPILMHDVIDNKSLVNDAIINNLFLEKRKHSPPVQTKPDSNLPLGLTQTGAIVTLKENYGFVNGDNLPDNLFFHQDNIVQGHFKDLQVGDMLQYAVGHNGQTPCAQEIKVVQGPFKELHMESPPIEETSS